MGIYFFVAALGYLLGGLKLAAWFVLFTTGLSGLLHMLHKLHELLK